MKEKREGRGEHSVQNSEDVETREEFQRGEIKEVVKVGEEMSDENSNLLESQELVLKSQVQDQRVKGLRPGTNASMSDV